MPGVNFLLTFSDQCLRTPLVGKTRLGAPLQSNRKALGVINKVVATPAASLKAEEKTKPAESKVVFLRLMASFLHRQLLKSFVG